MKHIFKNLLRHKVSVAAIILLLIMQAYCDLALPTYTSGIVDVGLQQYGIEDCVMKEIRHSTGDALQQFLSEDEKAAFSDAYVLNEDELKLAGKCLAEGLRAYRKQVMGLR